MKKIDLYFDVSSPWTYLGYTRLHPLAKRHGAEIIYHPILVGAVFNAVNDTPYKFRANPHPLKEPYMAADMQAWARLAGIKIKWRPTIFPVRAVEPMRAVVAAGELGKMHEFATAAFEAYWEQDKDISNPAVLDELAKQVGLDSQKMAERRASPEVKEKLKTNTNELIARGGFGSPTMYVNNEMYFGNDRLELIDAALGRAG